MLEHLFGSRTRVKLLKHFFQDPTQRFYVRELTREVGEQINSVRREIANLQKIGILKEVITERTAARGGIRRVDSDKRKFYTIDRSFALYDELRNLITKSQLAIQKDLCDMVQKLGSVKLLLLAGFFVEQKGPTDVLVVGSMHRDRLKQLITRFEKTIGQEINYTVFSLPEFNLRYSMTDRFLYDILGSKKIVMVNKIPNIDL